MDETLPLAEFAAWGYGLTAFVYAGFALYMYAAWRGALVGGCLLLAVILSCLWALANLWYARAPSTMAYFWSVGLDVLRSGGWFAFLLILLRPLLAGSRRRFLLAACGVLGAQLAGMAGAGFALMPAEQALKLNFGGSLAGAVLGLALVEQLFRGIPQDARWALKPLCMGLGAAYMFELYLFADAFLFGRQSTVIWLVRGPAYALVVPLIAVSGARNPSWSLRMSLSREAVFHTTALGISGIYLLAVAAAGYYVRYFGGEWGQALQIMLLFAAMVLLAVFMSSSAQRARLRVLISKHLFPYRYDYRIEWLRFTRALSASGDERFDLGQSVVAALADLVESPGGVLWLRRGGAAGGDYAIQARRDQPGADVVEPADSPFARFMCEREWIIDLEEYRRSPTTYPGLQLPDWLAAYFPGAWLLIPLTGGMGLIGFVMLAAARTRFEVDWEVLDLLKTARHQAASYLERMLAAEDLLEARKFESFTRMSAFVVHDLKNLVAQLSLVLRNAERHKDNPEFQADMLETVAHVETKMRGLMAQLQEKRSIDPPRAVSLAKVLENVRHAKREQRPPVMLDIPADGGAIVVRAHPERIERVIGHMVQNALEATPEDGSVAIRLENGGDRVRVVIEDSGCGMSEAFIRECLSRPFETTKINGMGIGVYETQQYIRELGGNVSYDSTEGIGTRVSIDLPVHTRLDVEWKETPGNRHD